LEFAAAPATVTGERSSHTPLRPRPREGGRKQRPGSQETCLAPSSSFRPGCAGSYGSSVAATR